MRGLRVGLSGRVEAYTFGLSRFGWSSLISVQTAFTITSSRTMFDRCDACAHMVFFGDVKN